MAAATERWRLFVAIDLSDEARDALATAQRVCRRHGPGLPVRWVDPQGAHLTVKFLGEVARERVAAIEGALRRIASMHQPFHLRTGPPGAFPNERRPRVLWLGLTGPLDRLGGLRDGVELALHELGFPREDRPFHPHLTLGRVREAVEARSGRPAGLAAAFAELHGGASAPFPVDALRLMRSELGPGRPRYTTLAVARLGAPIGPED